MKSGKSVPARAPVSAPDLEAAYQRARASIAFTAQDIRDIREGRLRITHRPFSSRFSPGGVWHHMLEDITSIPPAYCSFGMPGAWVWVREPYTYDRNGIVYLADLADLTGLASGQKLHGRPVLASRRMAKHQSRLLLRLDRVEPKWFLDITAEEIQAEGCPSAYLGDTRAMWAWWTMRWTANMANQFARMRHAPLSIHMPVWALWFTAFEMRRW